MDPRAVAAREAHRLSLESLAHAKAHRDRRDALVRRLYEGEEPWSYTRIAKAVGISRELVAYIIKGGSRVRTPNELPEL